jgi:imidazolonepropionase-like amidohydrolase
MLLRGFTTVRDTSGADFALREAIAEGLVPGPRLFIAGTALSQTGGHGAKIQPLTTSPILTVLRGSSTATPGRVIQML